MMATKALLAESTEKNIASPGFKRSLEGEVAPLREMFIEAARALPPRLPSVEAWLGELKTHDIETVDAQDRSAWVTVGILTVCWIIFGVGDPRQALSMFGVPANGDKLEALVKASELICAIDRNRASALLPYLLDTYGRTSRLDVLRHSARKNARNRRKAAGSFYTPQDVAAFMVQSISCKQLQKDQIWFDPAVGSGVFLLEALKAYEGDSEKNAFARNNLYGSDISPVACDFTAIMLAGASCANPSILAETFVDIRSNLFAVDATELHGGDARQILDRLLPEGAPRRLICNPPYVRGNLRVGADGHPISHLYLHFVQLATTVAGGGSDAASFVLPLAMGANRSSDHRRVRSTIQRTNGRWTFLFFDRQPHALFGEDAKTRATILLKQPSTAPVVETSSLLKWTSKQRPAIFSANRAIAYTGPIGPFLPKLGSIAEFEIYEALEALRSPLRHHVEISKATATEIVGRNLSNDVFVAGTAYNFLNVFRNYPNKQAQNGELSASGIHKITSADRVEASVRTALLSSLTTFWLWHVECDGFHVPTYFLKDLALLATAWSPSETDKLASLGGAIWTGLSQDIVVSVNAGKRTFAFRPSQIRELRREVDQVVFDKLCLSHKLIASLEEFESRTVSIDGSDRGSRQHSKRVH